MSTKVKEPSESDDYEEIPIDKPEVAAEKKEPKPEKLTTIHDFDVINKIGDGAYSNVYKVKRIEDGQLYALKKVKLDHLSDKERENAINEVRILASVQHPNVIQYKDAFMDDKNDKTKSLNIVMELADNGDVFQKIVQHKKDKTYIKERQIWQIFIQAVRGLQAMHKIKIMHRDLKSANIFLYNNMTTKLGDMNVSKVTNSKGLNYTQTGTPYYASPEVWKDEPYDVKSDVWSLGCVIYEMVTLKPPFQAEDMQGLYKKILKGQLPKIPEHFSSDLWNLLKLMIQVNSRKRPNTDQLMEHPIFRKRSLKYFPEFEEEQYESNFHGQSFLLKTIRIPKNIMHLSSRLPKKNYDGTLNINYNSEERMSGAGGVSFKAGPHYHNTMGRKQNKSKDQPDLENVNDGTTPNKASPQAMNRNNTISPTRQEIGQLKLPQIQNQGDRNNNSQMGQYHNKVAINKKSPYESISQQQVNIHNLNDKYSPKPVQNQKSDQILQQYIPRQSNQRNIQGYHQNQQMRMNPLDEQRQHQQINPQIQPLQGLMDANSQKQYQLQQIQLQQKRLQKQKQLAKQNPNDQNSIKVHQMKKIAASYNLQNQELKIQGKKKNDLMNAYFQNNNSIGELDTVETQGHIAQKGRPSNNSSTLAKYGQQLAPIKNNSGQGQMLTKQRSHKQSLIGLQQNRNYLNSLQPNNSNQILNTGSSHKYNKRQNGIYRNVLPKDNGRTSTLVQEDYMNNQSSMPSIKGATANREIIEIVGNMNSGGVKQKNQRNSSHLAAKNLSTNKSKQSLISGTHQNTYELNMSNSPRKNRDRVSVRNSNNKQLKQSNQSSRFQQQPVNQSISISKINTKQNISPNSQQMPMPLVSSAPNETAIPLRQQTGGSVQKGSNEKAPTPPMPAIVNQDNNQEQ